MIKQNELFEVKCSVHELVDQVYSDGDIDHRFFSMERAQIGSTIHRLLQSTSKDDYDSEVFLKYSCIYEDISFSVEGRADGIIHKDDKIIVDEIKTVNIPLANIKVDYKEVHWAQVKCYAFFYATNHSMESIDVQLTYYQIEEETIKQFIKTYTYDELYAFFQDTLQLYYRWATMDRDFNQIKLSSIQALPFPFSTYREGQRTLAVAVYKTILDQDVLYTQAPTGIGKTISTLFPSIKAIGEHKIDKIFYLTAKSITRSVAQHALLLLEKKGLRIKSIVINAKDKMCFLEERNCDPEVCPFASNYYNRVDQAMYELLQGQDAIDETVLKSYGKKFKVCPFELSLDLSLHCDVIICDYNYLFDPSVYLKRFFMDMPEKYMFLIDEAHNLVDRSRSMYSSMLHQQTFTQVEQLFPKDERIALHKSFASIHQYFNEKKANNLAFEVSKEPLLDFQEILNKFLIQCELALQDMDKNNESKELTTLYFDVVSYLRIADLYDEHFVTTIKRSDLDIEIKQFCIDPGLLVRHSLKKGEAACLFSATLTPIHYFLELLGGDETSKRLLLQSPFDADHLKIIVYDSISTRYKDRNQSVNSIVEIIYESVMRKAGNYIVYFPSYAYMNQIYQAFVSAHPNITTTLQHGGMSELEKEAFLLSFQENRNQLLVGFCVLGGMYGEGIDLVGDALIASIIIGVGLPQINPEQNILRDYFEHKNQMGYPYAYVFPGMNKVLQAGGRVIRSNDDIGAIILIDDRYTTPIYQNLLPKHWQHFERINNIEDLKLSLNSFWQKK
ncbi:MAG: ATP-dependent DNA helicase [Erysipelotrichaceae bacterium]